MKNLPHYFVLRESLKIEKKKYLNRVKEDVSFFRIDKKKWWR